MIEANDVATGGHPDLADLSPEELSETLGRLRKEAEGEIERLIDLLDKTDPYFDEREHAVDDDPIDDMEEEPSLGFLESHPTNWNGNGSDRSGSQVGLCVGLGSDLEDEHDGGEPNVDDKPSIGYDVEPAEQDTGDAEPNLGWTERAEAGGGVCAGSHDREQCVPVGTAAQYAREMR